MRKSILFFILFIFLFTSCTKQNVNNPPKNNKKPNSSEKTLPAIDNNIITYNNSISALLNNIDNKLLEKLEVKDLIIYTNGIRTSQKPYKTTFKHLKNLENNIKRVNSYNYIIEVNSGPGVSWDGKISTIFTNKTEALYFSKMVKEIIKRHSPNKHFQGISINIASPDIPEKNYYSTLNYIIAKVRSSYPDTNIIYNLHPLSFETGYKMLPKLDLNNITLSTEIYLKGISYPGYGAGYKSSITLDRNSILKNMKKIKDIQDKYKLNILITVKIPWADSSDIMLQDIYELSKTLGFKVNICYLNSKDIYNFSKNEDILQIIKRHN